jgi:hypothetical protein
MEKDFLMTLLPFGRSRGAARPSQARPACEGLEGRQLPSASTISGFVYHDVNSDGLYNGSDTPIAGSTLELFKGQGASGTPIATAVSDANGAYQFATDNTVSTAPATRTVVATFDSAKTGWSKTAQVAQFDPSLGTLTGVEIINKATLQTEYQVENLDAQAGTLTAAINGRVTVSAPGVSALATPVSSSNSFDAAAFDGNIDFTGPSGHDSGLQTNSGQQPVTLTDPGVLQQFEGTGSVSIAAQAGATSTASGPGNMLTLTNASAGAEVDVVYTYTPSNALPPGTYTVVQPATPQGYLPGRKSSGGSVIPNSTTSNSITVTLSNGNSTHNDFAELQPSSLSGYVYVDQNNDGIRQSSEPPVPGTTVTLTGTDSLGAALAPVVVQTDGNGFYHFDSLAPGSYTITATQPAGYVPGINSLGTVNGVPRGTVGTDQFFVTVAQDESGINYDFGEQLPAPLPQAETPPVMLEPPAAAPPAPAAPPPAPPAPPLPMLSKVLFLSSTFGRNF